MKRQLCLVCVASLLGVLVSFMTPAFANGSPPRKPEPSAQTDANVVAASTDGDEEVQIELAEKDDTISGSLDFYNVGGGAVTVRMQETGAFQQCKVSEAPRVLAKQRSTTVKFTTTGCDLDTNKVATLVVVPVGDRGRPQTITGQVTLKKDTTVEREASLVRSLDAFKEAGWLALGTVLLAVVCALLRYKRNVLGALPSVPDSWKFTDSWASNLTLGATAFVAIFGAKDAVTALFGEASERLVADLLVVGLIAALLVGVAPLFLKMFGSPNESSGVGLAIAGLFTLWGALGQVGASKSLLRHAQDADSTAYQLSGCIGLALATLLVVYAFVTLLRLLGEASAKKPTAEPSDALLLAAAVASQGASGPTSVLDSLKPVHTGSVAFLQYLKDRATRPQARSKKSVPESEAESEQTPDTPETPPAQVDETYSAEVASILGSGAAGYGLLRDNAAPRTMRSGIL